ncbi:MAG: ribosome maturation factor RimM [Acidobacteriaceae bacterium]
MGNTIQGLAGPVQSLADAKRRPARPEQWVSLARVIRPQGRRGEVVAEIMTDFPQRLSHMRNAFLRRGTPPATAPIVIQEAWLHKGRVVLKFEKTDSISDAELLRGAEVVIPADARATLDEGAVYISELIGCQLVDRNQHGGAVAGTIRDVVQQENAADMLILTGNDGAEHWVPFALGYDARVDLPARRVEMSLPIGLLEVNAPLTEEERQAQSIEASAEQQADTELDLPS